MALIQQTVISRLQPGRFEEFLSLSGQAAKVYERLGASNTRVTLAGAAGESAGTTVFSSEHASMEAFGAFAEKMATDDEMQSILARLRSADSPVTIEQISLASELPTGRKTKAGKGTVIEVHASRATPGRIEDALALGIRCCDFVEANGATNARLFQLGYAGLGVDTMVTSWEYANQKAWGKGVDAWASKDEGMAIGLEAASASTPSTHIYSAVYTEIPV